MACAATAAGLFANRPSATPPRQEAVMYSLDSDTGEARWASWEAPRSDWSRRLLTEEPTALDEAFPRFTGEELWHGPAPAADLVPPRLAVLGDTTTDGDRELTLRLSSPRGARSVGLWVDAETATVLRAVVDGRAIATTPGPGPWDFGFVFEGAPADGVEVRLTLEQPEQPEQPGQHGEEVALLVADRTDDLGVVPGFRAPQQRVVAYPEVTVTSRVTV